MTVGMPVPVSTPPPGAPAPSAKPIGGLKKLDNKRVIARLIDAVIVGIPAVLAQETSDEFGAYWVFMALSLIYFFVCEATMSQTLGKRAMGLRVMTRDGRAPSINAVSIRTVLRLIDDGPIGAAIMVLSGERRQRLGDLAAGTAVGRSEREVPRPEANALLVAYPVAWLIGAFGFITLVPSPASAAEYSAQVSQICRAADIRSEPDIRGWVPLTEAMYTAHAALEPPPEYAAVHAALLQSDAELADIVRRASIYRPDTKIVRDYKERALYNRAVSLNGLFPGCA
jgi:uncharacterized RDD family membrane protein YckC